MRPDSSGDSSVGGQREALLGELRRLKARRESVLEERRKLELKLQQTNTNVQKMVRKAGCSCGSCDRKVTWCVTCLERGFD